MISNDNNAKPKVIRRSSFKSKNLNIKPNPNPNSSVKKNGKRTSISWGQIDTFEFNEMKPTFQENEGHKYYPCAADIYDYGVTV